jgi:hypothetical protein
MPAVFALCTNCDLRAGPTQCELSDQEQATPRALLPRTASRPSAGMLARGLREAGKDSGGFQ